MNEIPADLLESFKDTADPNKRNGSKSLACMVRRLQEASGTKDFSGCVTMSLQEGLDYCWAIWTTDEAVCNRMKLLRRFGFRHSDELEAMTAGAAARHAEWVQFGPTKKPGRFQTYLELAQRLGPSP